MNHRKITPKVIEKLGDYVYLYIDPRDSTIFYLWKGQGNCAFSHLSDASEFAQGGQDPRNPRRGPGAFD